MSRSRRSWNRILLALLGAVWLAVGALVAVLALEPGLLAPARPALALATDALAPIGGWTAVLVAVAVVVLGAGVAHAASRGRGRTGDAAAVGGIAVDVRTLEDAYREALGAHPDVLGASVAAWRLRRGATAWRASVRVRPGARVDEIVDRAARAARAVREQVGVDAPIVVHVTGGMRSSLSATRRAA